MSDNNKTLKQRNEIAEEYKWDIESMYPDENQWHKDVADSIKAAEEFKRFQGRIAENADTLYAALVEKDATSSCFSKSKTFILRRASLSRTAVPMIPPPMTIQSYFIFLQIPKKAKLYLTLNFFLYDSRLSLMISSANSLFLTWKTVVCLPSSCL